MKGKGVNKIMRFAKHLICAMLLTTVVAASAQTDTINVTVSLQVSLGVSLDESAWNIGPLALGGTASLTDIVATNTGNVAETFAIKGANGAGGWTIGSSGADSFNVAVSGAATLNLTATDQTLATGLATAAPGNTATFALTYTAPTSDTKGAGVAQGFDITVTASAD
jgi:hypothetical protein